LLDDGAFWSPYNINSDLLNADLVRLLEEYSMLKLLDGDETDHAFSVTGQCIYGFFRPDGTLYKICQPENTERKYLKADDYLQGARSLTGYPYLCIGAGLKDILALKSLKLRVDFVAADSENNLLSYGDFYKLQQPHQYQAMFTLLDIDKTGLESMQACQQRYGLPFGER